MVDDDDSYPLLMTNIAIEHGPVEIVSFPIKNGEWFSIVMLVYQKAMPNNDEEMEVGQSLHFEAILKMFCSGNLWGV